MSRTPAQILAALQRHVRFSTVLHGPPHWARVHRFGVLLADRLDLSAEARACVELFAWVHDLARENDEADRRHAEEGAAQLEGVLPDVTAPLTSDQVEVLRTAIRHHSDGMVAGRAWEAGLFEGIGWPRDLVVAAVGCCWDADRLDLPRVGIAPTERYMSTPVWREVRPLSARIHDGASSGGPVTTTYDPSSSARQRARERGAPEGSAAAVFDVWPRRP